MHVLPAPSPTDTSPRLAFVVGSGGIRSIAAIGMAEALAGEGIRPDLWVGCSSGALFGATIAMGMSSGEALRTAQALWSAELTQQRRWLAYAQLVLPRLAGFNAGFALRDDRLIAQRVAQAFGDLRLEALPTPLRVAATDAATGEPVVLTQGRVVDALRASMALPFLFPSVEIDGRRLVDGVISDPLPIGAAGDAQAVIALGFRGQMPRRIDRPSRLMAQITTAMTNNLLHARTQAAQAAGQRVLNMELQIDPRIGLWETGAMHRVFEAGRRAAQARMPQILALLAREPEALAA